MAQQSAGAAADAAQTARETSWATVGALLGHLRARGGEPLVRAVLARAGAAPELADGCDRDWISYAERIRLFAAAVDEVGDQQLMFRVGAQAVRDGVNASLVILLRALGSPRRVYGQVPRAVARFSSTSTMEVREAGRDHAVISFRLHDGYEHSRLDCQYVQGLLSGVPEIFGDPPARVEEERCQSDGHASCVYRVRWRPRSRRPWRRPKPDADEPAEVVALRHQLHALQSAAAELVAGDDLDAVLDSIPRHAASAVLAQGYLLCVQGPGGERLIRHAGIDAERAQMLSRRLVEGGDLGPSAVVVDVATRRRRHGRLAALHFAGQAGVEGEAELLSAYAGHAAAALDLHFALADARRGEERAERLLDLSRCLNRARSAQEVIDTAVAAIPEVVGSTRAGILLWDPKRGVLSGRATAGMTEAQDGGFRAAELSPGSVPELAELLAVPRVRLLRRADVAPAVARLLDLFGVEVTAIAPLLGDDRLLGVLVVRVDGDDADPEERLERMQGVADQTSIALRNTLLVARIRHQSLHDPLTGLPNRVLFGERLAGRLGRLEHDERAAVLFCDLDGFKAVNDTHGHAAGDALLRAAAGRLRESVGDAGVVARLAGDEFAVLLDDVASDGAARELAQAVATALGRPYEVDGRHARVTTSVGVAVQRGPDGSAEALLREADAAMYRIKRGDEDTRGLLGAH